jgi:heat shock protein HtpX
MTLQQQIRANRLRTGFLLALFLLLIGGLSLLTGRAAPLMFAVGVAYGIFSWFSSWRMVGKMTGAKVVSRDASPALFNLVDTMAIAAGLAKTPEVRIVDDPAPNAFASGRDPDHSFIAVTTGLLQKLDKRELEAVVAHEMSHIRNRDVKLMTLTVVLVGVVAFLSDIILRLTIFGGRRRDANPYLIVLGLIALVVAPLSAIGIQLAISRRREYLADASAAAITNDPEGVALALRALLWDQSVIRDTSRSTALLYIESPLHKASGVLGAMGGMFNTHPALEQRIQRLEQAGGFSLDLTPPAHAAKPQRVHINADGTVDNPNAQAIPMPGVVGAYAQPQERVIFCTHCGHALGADGVCTNCGKPSEILTKAPAPTTLSSTVAAMIPVVPLQQRRDVFCTHCGHALGADGYCTNCGRPSEVLFGAEAAAMPRHEPNEPSAAPPPAEAPSDADPQPPSFASFHKQ